MPHDLTEARQLAAATTLAPAAEYLRALLVVTLATLDRDALDPAPSAAPAKPDAPKGKGKT